LEEEKIAQEDGGMGDIEKGSGRQLGEERFEDP